MTSSRIIPLAQIVREHGVPKPGRHVYKADFFNVGSSLFSTHVKLHIQESPNAEWRACEMSDAASPMGGKWGQSKGVLLTFAFAVPRGSLVGMPRDYFPQLESGEIYVCDLIGLPVSDEKGSVGRVVGYSEPGKGAPLNLVVQPASGPAFGFPMKWVDWAHSGVERGVLQVPGVRQWQNL